MNSKKNVLNYGRFKGLPWFDKISQSTIFIGGAGGISSWLALFLARTGARIVVIDNDTVEIENLAGQCYGKEDIEKPKVKAISDVITRLCGENNVVSLESLVDENEGQWRQIVPKCDVVCVGFDNLKARRLIYEHWKAHGRDNSLFVDGRLSAENGQIFVLDKTNKEEDFLAYEQTYFPDSERIELPCTMKATTHCGALIASLMTSQITNWFNNQTPDTMPRDVVNMEFHLQLMLFDQPRYEAKKKEEPKQKEDDVVLIPK